MDPRLARVRRFPRRAVAALFLERQWLDRPRGRRLSGPAVARFAERVGGIQLDSINVVERAHYLTLWSRFDVYDRRALDRLVWKRRVLLEYWAHAACLVAASDFPAWRRAMLDYRRRHSGWGAWLRRHRPTLERVEAAIRANGPLGSADFERGAPRRGAQGWWNWKDSTHALDYLWKKGRLAVDSRVHFHKRFDLAERVYGERLAGDPLDRDAFRAWHLRKALFAQGAATETDLRAYLTFPRLGAPERRVQLERALHVGEVVEISVEGDRGRWYALAGDLPALEAAARRRIASRGTTLLSPFDSFLWHRDRVARLFDFDYRIEVYVPPRARVHGYYSMPILHDGRLVGRVDPKTHRDRGVLEVRNAHLERPLPGEDALPALAAALRSLARFVGAHRIVVRRVAPARLGAPLRRALGEQPL